MTIHGALHPKSDVDRIYVPRGKGGRGLISCEGCIRAEENSLGWYINHSPENSLGWYINHSPENSLRWYINHSPENSLGWYINHSPEQLLQLTKDSKVIETESCIELDEFKKVAMDELRNAWREKKCMVNRPVSQLSSIRGKRCDSLYNKKSTSYHYVAKTRTKLFHALLRAVHTFEI